MRKLRPGVQRAWSTIQARERTKVAISAAIRRWADLFFRDSPLQKRLKLQKTGARPILVHPDDAPLTRQVLNGTWDAGQE